MRHIPKAESPDVREAFIAGASLADTPVSNASWAVVFRWPGARKPVSEASGRIPKRVSDAEPRTSDAHHSYPGTMLAAEWFACLQAIRRARNFDSAREKQQQQRTDAEVRSEPFFPDYLLPDASPLRLFTTNPGIVEVLEGRVSLANRRWLRYVQHIIGNLTDCRIITKGDRYFFRPADRPYPGHKPQRSDRVPVYTQLIKADANRRARRLAREALSLQEQPETSPW